MSKHVRSFKVGKKGLKLTFKTNLTEESNDNIRKEMIRGMNKKSRTVTLHSAASNRIPTEPNREVQFSVNFYGHMNQETDSSSQIQLDKSVNRKKKVTMLPEIYKQDERTFYDSNNIQKYELPNSPNLDLKEVGQNYNPYYYPYVAPEPSTPSLTTIPMESSSKSTFKPTIKITSGTFIKSEATAGDMLKDEKSVFGQDKKPFFKRRRSIFLNSPATTHRKKSILGTAILKEGTAHLRRLQSGLVVGGDDLDDWDWRGKEVSVISKREVKKKARKKKPAKKGKKGKKKKKEEYRETRLPFHPFTCKPKYMIVSPTKPFRKYQSLKIYSLTPSRGHL